MTSKAKRPVRQKITREEIVNELLDALSTVRVGYPYFGVDQTIRRALRYIREQEPALLPVHTEVIGARLSMPTCRPTWSYIPTTCPEDVRGARYFGRILDADLNSLAECVHSHGTKKSAQSCADKMFVQKYNLKLPFER